MPAAPAPFTHRNLPGLLLQAREAVMAHTRPALRARALSDQQWRVLRVLRERGTVETGHIAREAFIPGPSLTGVPHRMERDGLIVRERDQSDQRRAVVRASEQGMERVATLPVTIEQHYEQPEEVLGKQKLAQLDLLLDTLIAMEQVDGRARLLADRHRPWLPLLCAPGWDACTAPVEIITPYVGSSGTGQINAIFPVTPLET